MKTTEAVEICREWFRYLDRQRAKAKRLAELAALARTGPEGHAQARREMNQIDKHPTVYDGGRLEPAVRQLLKAIGVEN